MKLFKESKHQPIKFRGFKYIGVHENYPHIVYYYKSLIIFIMLRIKMIHTILNA